MSSQALILELLSTELAPPCCGLDWLARLILDWDLGLSGSRSGRLFVPPGWVDLTSFLCVGRLWTEIALGC